MLLRQRLPAQKAEENRGGDAPDFHCCSARKVECDGAIILVGRRGRVNRARDWAPLLPNIKRSRMVALPLTADTTEAILGDCSTARMRHESTFSPLAASLSRIVSSLNGTMN
jgi:hypothetical protein